MGLRGPGSMASKLRDLEPHPEPSPVDVRREKRLELLRNKALGLGFKLEAAPYGKVAIVADAHRIEQLIDMARGA
jgi:hypothetical protein